MEALGLWIAVIGGVLGLAGGLTAAVVTIRSRIASATIDLLNQNQDAQKRRIETLETENRVLRQRVEALEHTKDELFTQVKSLPAFTEMSNHLDELTSQMTKLIKLIERERREKG